MLHSGPLHSHTRRFLPEAAMVCALMTLPRLLLSLRYAMPYG